MAQSHTTPESWSHAVKGCMVKSGIYTSHFANVKKDLYVFRIFVKAVVPKENYPTQDFTMYAY